jgi:hypothetical protein
MCKNSSSSFILMACTFRSVFGSREFARNFYLGVVGC